MAERKVYLGSQGPYLFDDTDLLGDPDGDFSGQAIAGLISDSQIIATEFLGVPISSISVSNIDDPSSELNSLSASTVGGLIAVYEAVAGSDDEFTMYLWDTNAASENVPYTVDGDGGVWISVAGKYVNGDVYFSGGISGGHTYNVENESSAYTASFNDFVRCDGTFTVTLPNIVARDVGKSVVVYNEGSGTITVDGDGSDTVDGSADITVSAGNSVKLVSVNISSWYSI